RVLLLAPTAHQIRDILWREIKRLYRGAKIPLGGQINDLPSLGLVYPDGRQIQGLSTDDGDRLSGLSGQILAIVDEASAFQLFDALEGVLAADGSRLILISNPSQNSGYFYETHRG